MSRIEMIDPDELAERLGDGGRRELVVLDVRDADEFGRGHIPGSVHIPFGELPERSGELPRDSTIAAVCSGGKRSGLAASLLQREGFERVLHVANGGVGTWERQGRRSKAGSPASSAVRVWGYLEAGQSRHRLRRGGVFSDPRSCCAARPAGVNLMISSKEG